MKRKRKREKETETERQKEITFIQIFSKIQHNRYVRPSASRTVNLADPTRQKLGQIATKQIPLTKDCFKEAQLEVLHMLDG